MANRNEPQMMADESSYYTREQINSIIHACRNEEESTLIWLVAKTGRRISEIVRNLKPSDFHEDRGMINFVILKRRVPTRKMIPVSPIVFKVMRKYWRVHDIKPNEPIWKMHRVSAWRCMHRAARRAGLGLGQLRALRHSFAIEAAKTARTPADIVHVKELLAHSDINMTMYYLKFNPEEQRRIIDRMWTRKQEV